MSISQLARAAAIGGSLLLGQSAFGADIFIQNFDYGANQQAWLDSWSAPAGSGEVTTTSTYNGVTETIFASANVHAELPDDSPITERAWGVHDGGENPWVSGGLDHPNPLMSGNVLGHEEANYDADTTAYYQIDGIDLTDVTDAELTFQFDSWITSTPLDGFAVAYSTNDGTDWALLNPSTDVNNYSNMQYEFKNPGTTISPSEQTLAGLTGQTPNADGEFFAFDGHQDIANANTNPFAAGLGQDTADGLDSMAGAGIFDLSGIGQNVISLRFAFASDNDSNVAEGINIDNIVVTGTEDDPGGSNAVPEPLTLGLALAGVALVGRRRRWWPTK